MIENRICQTCGGSFLFRLSPSRVGRGKYCSKSCGNTATSRRHGHAGTDRKVASKTYTTWATMTQRCHNPSNSKYRMYGANGICVCPEWRDSFAAFLQDMGERPEGMTIDRIDGSRGYEPGNCRWASPKTQQRNLKTNVFVEYQGHKKCLAEWAEIYAIHPKTLGFRIKSGWDLTAAFTTPPRLGNRISSRKSSSPPPFA
jgi:hypothetical protein